MAISLQMEPRLVARSGTGDDLGKTRDVTWGILGADLGRRIPAADVGYLWATCLFI